jgi:hypothetical protein
MYDFDALAPGTWHEDGTPYLANTISISDFNYDSAGSVTVTVNTGTDTGCMIDIIGPTNLTVYHKWRATGISNAMLRFSHCVVDDGNVPSAGKALTGKGYLDAGGCFSPYARMVGQDDESKQFLGSLASSVLADARLGTEFSLNDWGISAWTRILVRTLLYSIGLCPSVTHGPRLKVPRRRSANSASSPHW